MNGVSFIDCCVYHEWRQQRDLMEYMPAAWREFLGAGNRLPGGYGLLPLTPAAGYQSPDGNRKSPRGERSFAEEGIYDYQSLAQTSLADESVRRVVLMCRSGMLAPAHPNYQVGLEVCRAVNRWTVEQWFGNDSRVFGLIMAPNHLPLEAAEEIRGAGRHPQMAGVLMCANGIGKPFGHPLYEPIVAAACEMDLPIVIHVGGDATPDTISETTAGGQPATYAEYHMFAMHSVMTHVVSMISQGVLERFPALRLVAVGTGVLGLPSVMWRLDGNYRALQREVPWLKYRPSEYFQRQVRMLTYPMDQGPSVDAIVAAQQSFDGLEEQVCFGSGSPAWDSCTYPEVMERIPKQWSARVAYENAVATFRMP